MRIEQCSDGQLFYNVLMGFEDCFPHLKEKVLSLREYAQKVVTYGHVLLAVENETIIGLCAFYDNDAETKVGYITLIGVQKDYRKRQAGKSLLAGCEELMRNHGMISAKLEVDDDNVAAKRFYVRMGYQESEKASATSHYMSKQLQMRGK